MACVLPLKADPLARATEAPPATASVVVDRRRIAWHDEAWMRGAARRQATDAPISIYEVHAGIVVAHPDGRIARPGTSWPSG